MVLHIDIAVINISFTSFVNTDYGHIARPLLSGYCHYAYAINIVLRRIIGQLPGRLGAFRIAISHLLAGWYEILSFHKYLHYDYYAFSWLMPIAARYIRLIRFSLHYYWVSQMYAILHTFSWLILPDSCWPPQAASQLITPLRYFRLSQVKIISLLLACYADFFFSFQYAISTLCHYCHYASHYDCISWLTITSLLAIAMIVIAFTLATMMPHIRYCHCRHYLFQRCFRQIAFSHIGSK